MKLSLLAINAFVSDEKKVTQDILTSYYLQRAIRKSGSQIFIEYLLFNASNGSPLMTFDAKQFMYRISFINLNFECIEN